MSIYNSLKLDKTLDTPLYIQLANKLMELMEQKELPPNTKLPPIRVLAKLLDVNSVTVVNAYKYLESKKAVYSHVGSGTFVAELGLNDNTPVSKAILTQKNIGLVGTENCINLADTSVSEELFPVTAFKQFFNKVLDRDKGSAFSYQDATGYQPLRETIAAMLDKSAIKTSAERIQIISGAQQGLDIISKAMLNVNDVVFTEKPTYYGALGAIFSRGAQAVEIPLDNDGIDINVLKKLLKIYTPKFIYVMPRYQTPTGICYSLKRKRELLELAYSQNFYIVEEDNMGDFVYGADKPIPLKALDYRNRVIYIKSFSKILMPGLRIGYMVLPRPISQAVQSAKHSTDISTSGFIQRAFELYLKSGEHYRHIDRICAFYRKKYELMTSLTNELLSPYFTFGRENGGLTLWLKIRDDNITADELYPAFAKNGVLVTTGSVFTAGDEDIERHIRISFANVNDEQIQNGIALMHQTLQKKYSKRH